MQNISILSSVFKSLSLFQDWIREEKERAWPETKQQIFEVNIIQNKSAMLHGLS